MTITATEFKNNLGKYLDMAVDEDILITKNGRPIAKLSNPFQEKIEMAASLVGILKGNDMTIEEARMERLKEK